MQLTSGTLFIADRLRNIPLVSSGAKVPTSKNDTNDTSQNSDALIKQNNVVVRGEMVANNNKSRAEQQPRRRAADVPLAFAPHKATASTAKIVRQTPALLTTTTRKPKAPKMTTTQRPPAITTRRSARVMQQQQQQQRNAKQSGATKPPARQLSTTAAMLMPKPTTTPMPTSTTTTTAPTTTTTTSTTTTTTTPATTTTTTMITMTTRARENAPPAKRQTAQFVPTPPGNSQRRTQAPSVRFQTNRLPGGAAYAGDKWVLFAQPDGRVSFFEGLVLASNVMIVCTIVLVILFGWMRSMRRKRHPPTPAPQADLLQQQPSTSSPSPLSMLLAKQQPNKRHAAADDKVSTSLTTSETKVRSAAAPQQSKAMAIVQPTEQKDAASDSKSMETATGTSSDFAPKQAQLQSEATSADVSTAALSDLPAGTSAANVVAGAVMAAAAEEQRERVQALADSFAADAAVEAAAADTAKEASKDAAVKADKKSSGRKSASSLDSIELPEALVDSIKQTSARVGEVAPSPNLLLGETEPSAMKKPPPPPQIDDVAKKQEPATSAKDGDKDANQVPSVQKTAQAERPQNPMGRDDVDPQQQQQQPEAVVTDAPESEVKNHPVVVNKLDRRKTDLELVDIRDDSVTSKMRAESHEASGRAGETWLSMDGVAVVQQQQQQQQQLQQQVAPIATAVSPSELIESRFHVDYQQRRRAAAQSAGAGGKNNTSVDSKQEEYVVNNIEAELEMDHKQRNRKYFVYVVHDGHFSARKECIARIELPEHKRRITLSEMRQLIANCQDISLTSLRRNKFKFVTETYRLLNENEDAAVLHQVYPTQGVFLKLNIPEHESAAYVFKSRMGRLSTSGANTPSSLAQATIASRRKAAASRPMRGEPAPAIAVGEQQQQQMSQYKEASEYGRSRASAAGRRSPRARSSGAASARRAAAAEQANKYPSIGRSSGASSNSNKVRAKAATATRKALLSREPTGDDVADGLAVDERVERSQSSGSGGLLTGAKRLFEATFNR